MTSKAISNGILRAVFILLAIALALYLIYAIRSVVGYLAIAGVIALLGRPIVRFLKNRLKFPNTLAVVVTMFLMLAVFMGIFALFIPLISEQGKNLSLLNINDLTNNLNSLYLEIMEYLGTTPLNVDSLINESGFEKNILQDIDLNFIPNILNTVLGGLSSFGIGLFSVLFISFFFLKDSTLLQNGILTFIPDKKEKNTVKSIDKINNLLSRYFAGILLQLFILFVIYTVTLLIVGVENAIVIAFLCALFNIIPYVGPIIGAVIMVVLTMTSYLGADFSAVILAKASYVLIGICIGQLVDNFFSQPFIFSNSVKSHPLEIFLVIIIAGLLFGALGMVVAVPVYTAIKVVLKEFLNDYAFVQKFTKNI